METSEEQSPGEVDSFINTPPKEQLMDEEEGIDNGEENADGASDPGEEHEFEIIDQVESEEEADGKDEAGERKRGGDDSLGNEDGDFSSDSDDFDDTELHAMLEKGVDKTSIAAKKQEEPADGAPIIKHKIVLQEFEADPFDILPAGWVCVTHNCGMPVYLHKESRVCTMARPYCLGSASTRNHDIPISAIPCLQYRRQIDKMTADTTDGMIEDVENTIDSKIPEKPASTPSLDVPSEVTNTTEEKAWVVSNGSFVKCPVGPQNEGSYVTEPSKIPPSSGTLRLNESNGYPSLETNMDITSVDSCGAPPMSEHIVDQCTGLEAGDAVIDSVAGDAAIDSVISSCALQKSVQEDDILNSQTLKTCYAQSCQTKPSLSDQCGDKSLAKETNEEKVCKNNCLGKTLSCDQEKVEVICDSVEKSNSISNGIVNNDCEESSGNACTQPQVGRLEVPDSSDVSDNMSNNNSLATIKRKLESLKNRHGGKLRKMDSGSSSMENMGMSVVKNKVACETTDAQNAANETLKAHAAEVKIKTAEERAKVSLLDSTTLHDYCEKLFKFKTIEVKKYRSWRERRKHIGEKIRRSRPELPSSTKLITCPILGNAKPDSSNPHWKKREFVLNPTGKSYLCILHEYMQRTLKIQPTYIFKELENSKTPYGATVTINNIEYGTGYASSKKVAKQEAAKETLKILIPDLFNKITDQEIKHNISDLSFFDEIKVTDPRVNELGNKVGQPSPFQLLLECLRRNFGMGNTQCDVSTQPMKNQKCEFSIKVGKHSATVVAKNKRDGKQLAAQAILAKLHPHIPSWGSLLRLYGTNMEKPVEKVEEMNEIKTHVPNHSVLDSLRDEMRKLHKQKEAIQSKGKIIISSKDLLSKVSGVDL